MTTFETLFEACDNMNLEVNLSRWHEQSFEDEPWRCRLTATGPDAQLNVETTGTDPLDVLKDAVTKMVSYSEGLPASMKTPAIEHKP